MNEARLVRTLSGYRYWMTDPFAGSLQHRPRARLKSAQECEMWAFAGGARRPVQKRTYEQPRGLNDISVLPKSRYGRNLRVD
jgi:hypothetical protein